MSAAKLSDRLFETAPLPVYVVSDYSDTIRERDPKAQMKVQAQHTKWNWPEREKVFTTRQDASDYIIERARGHVDAARLTLKLAEKRLSKCEMKFGATLQGGM